MGHCHPHFAAHVTTGFLKITHNGFALLGLAMAFAVITITARPDLRQAGEAQWSSGCKTGRKRCWARQTNPGAQRPHAGHESPGTAAEQARVAFWLSKKYRVAPEPLGLLVAEAYELGTRAKLDPTLILAVMAIESRFNPFAQSPVGRKV